MTCRDNLRKAGADTCRLCQAERLSRAIQPAREKARRRTHAFAEEQRHLVLCIRVSVLGALQAVQY